MTFRTSLTLLVALTSLSLAFEFADNYEPKKTKKMHLNYLEFNAPEMTCVYDLDRMPDPIDLNTFESGPRIDDVFVGLRD